MEKQTGFYTRELLKILTQYHDDEDRKSIIQGTILKEQETITPKIFANANMIQISNHQRKKEVKIFEHILALVVQIYYTSDHQITIKNLKQNNSIKNLKSTTQRKNKINKKQNKDQEQQQILNILLSPLKQDLEYGKLKRKLDIKRNCYF